MRSRYCGNRPFWKRCCQTGRYSLLRVAHQSVDQIGDHRLYNGYRAICGSEIDELTITEERFSALELIIEARKNGLQIEEVPIMIEEQEAGETEKPQLEYMFGLRRTILVTWAC